MKRKIKICIVIFAAVIFGTGVYFLKGNSGNVVIVKSNGEIIEKINLNEVTEPYSVTVECNGYNKIYVEKGKISVIEADCPDKLCMKQSESGIFPVVCLPHKMVIEKGDNE